MVVWRQIPGWEGMYEASDAGGIRSMDRVDSSGKRRRGRVLAANPGIHGYPVVNLSRNSRVTGALVHRLVLQTFVGECPVGMEACHADGDRTNNAVTNLRWDTSTENNRDIIRIGRHNNVNKTVCKNGHPLSPPNLLATDAALGRRRCLACRKEYSHAKYRGIEFSKQRADEYFTQIMFGT